MDLTSNAYENLFSNCEFAQGVAIGTTKAMAGKLTAPFVSKVKPKTGPSVVISNVHIVQGGGCRGRSRSWERSWTSGNTWGCSGEFFLVQW